MEVRDATQDDVSPLAEMAELPRRAVEGVLRNRTTRVAEVNKDVIGVVAFDTNDGTVVVTLLAGEPDTYVALLEEPWQFASRLGCATEMVVPATEEDIVRALEEAGYDRIEPGPRFAGDDTVRYRRTDDVI